jgi:hypothetical protein
VSISGELVLCLQVENAVGIGLVLVILNPTLSAVVLFPSLHPIRTEAFFSV